MVLHLPLLMAYSLIGEAFHEYLDIVMFPLLLPMTEQEIEGLPGKSGFDLDYCNVLYIGNGVPEIIETYEREAFIFRENSIVVTIPL